jgi:hypothetical protein
MTFSTLNGATTLFGAERNNAEARLRAVLKNGIDPGATLVPVGMGRGRSEVDPVAEVTDPVVAITSEASRDRLCAHLTETSHLRVRGSRRRRCSAPADTPAVGATYVGARRKVG